MAEYTPNLKLLKKDPAIDGNDTFNIQTMLNDNWDKVDVANANVDKVQQDLETHKADDAAHGWNEKKYKTVSGILSQNSDTSKTINVGFTPKLVICIANNGKYCYILNNDEVAIRFDSSGTPDSSSASGSIITTDYNTRLTSNGFKIGKYPDSDTSYLLNYVAFQ